jgi:hypothetical protein
MRARPERKSSAGSGSRRSRRWVLAQCVHAGEQRRVGAATRVSARGGNAALVMHAGGRVEVATQRGSAT